MGYIKLNDAIAAAKRSAEKSGEDRYIVTEDSEYHVASAYDMDTFFCGQRPIYQIEPDGQINRD